MLFFYSFVKDCTSRSRATSPRTHRHVGPRSIRSEPNGRHSCVAAAQLYNADARSRSWGQLFLCIGALLLPHHLSHPRTNTLLSPRVLSSLPFLFWVSGASVLELGRIKTPLPHSTTASAEVVRVLSGVMITRRWWSRCQSHTVKAALAEIEECRFCTYITFRGEKWM